MVKIVRYYPPGVPAWARLPQWEERTTPPPCKDASDVDMEGIELALEEKLVLPSTARLKRTRTDSIFEMPDEAPVKRARVPELRRAQSEQVPALQRLTSHLAKEDTRSEGTIQLQFDEKKNGRKIVGNIFAPPPPAPAAMEEPPTPEHIDLSNEPPSLTNHFLEWRSTKKISTLQRPCWASPSEKNAPDYMEKTTLDTEHLALCYGLGERLQNVAYRNAILRTIRHYVVEESLFPSDRSVAIIYENTEKGSPARRMMVDLWAHVGNGEWLEGESVRSSVCPEFLEDLVMALLRVREKPEGGSWPWKESAEAYMLSEEGTEGEEAMDL